MWLCRLCKFLHRLVYEIKLFPDPTSDRGDEPAAVCGGAPPLGGGVLCHEGGPLVQAGRDGKIQEHPRRPRQGARPAPDEPRKGQHIIIRHCSITKPVIHRKLSDIEAALNKPSHVAHINGSFLNFGFDHGFDHFKII